MFKESLMPDVKILEINDLSISYQNKESEVLALDNLSLDIARGESIGILGESGSGKSSLAHAIMGLIDPPHKLNGEINYQAENLLDLSDHERRKYLWREIALVFQNSLEVFNPTLRIGEQIGERLREVSQLSRQDLELETGRLLQLVGLDEIWQDAYPHQLSGGMRQRVLLAMALSCQPKVLILDEPTSSFDPQSQRECLELISKLQAELGFAIILISHDISVLEKMCSRLYVLYQGQVVESGPVQDLIYQPNHPYTRGLIHSSPALFPYKDLWGIPSEVNHGSSTGCNFAPRCTQALAECFQDKPCLVACAPKQTPASQQERDPDKQNYRRLACHRGGIISVLEVEDVYKTYQVGKKKIPAVRGVSFELRQGETVAMLGISGSGKSSIAKVISGFLPADKGQVYFKGTEILGEKLSNNPASLYGGIQLVLQDPYSAINPRFTIFETIVEPVVINKLISRNEQVDEVKSFLQAVGLPNDDVFLERPVSSLSGGQRQRVALARALIMRPDLLIADEVTSMLDLSSSANLMRLLKYLQHERGFTLLYITHDLHLARKIADKIIVVEAGKVKNIDSSNKLLNQLNKHQARTLSLVQKRECEFAN